MCKWQFVTKTVNTLNMRTLCLQVFIVVFIAENRALSILPLNNVCKTLEDYEFLLTSPNCWYNPDVAATAPDMIKRHGYPLEIHKAITEDNYILTMFRIPPKKKKPKGIIFFQHPAMCTSTVYIDLGNVSIAFKAHDAGYDVWLGNFRGTIYSPNHVYLSQEEEPNKYWNFSWHEMGLYDLPAQFEVVRKETNYQDKIYYIGHSVATSAAFVYSSLRPDHAKNNIKLFTCWSPMVHMEHGSSILEVAVPFSGIIMTVSELTHHMQTPTYDGILHQSTQFLCEVSIILCVAVYKMIFGPDHNNVNPEWFPILIHQSMAGFPIKAVVHNDQVIRSKGRFQWFDYGSTNQYYYHSAKPTVYPIENIAVPMHLVYGDRDVMAVGEDVIYIYNQLPKKLRYGIRKLTGYNHMDFHYGKGVAETLYEPTLRLIDQMQAKGDQWKIFGRRIFQNRLRKKKVPKKMFP